MAHSFSATMMFVFAGLLAGCASQERVYGDAFTAKPESGAVQTEIIFGTAAETAERCNGLNGNRYLIAGPPSCVRIRRGGTSTIYAVRPASWMDAPPICQLGHEVLHLRRAEH